MIIIDYKYVYDLNGNRITKAGSKHSSFYSYDKVNRLKECNYDGRKESYSYDNVGNRTSRTTNDVVEKYLYNVKNMYIVL